jgi:hypothetical protein
VNPLPSPSIVPGQRGVVIDSFYFYLYDVNGNKYTANVKASVTVPPGDDQFIEAVLFNQDRATRGKEIEVNTFTNVDVVVNVSRNALPKRYVVTVHGQLKDDNIPNSEMYTTTFDIEFPVELPPAAAQVKLSLKKAEKSAKAGESVTYKINLTRNEAAKNVPIQLRLPPDATARLRPTFNPQIVVKNKSELTVIAPSGASSPIRFLILGDGNADVKSVLATLNITQTPTPEPDDGPDQEPIDRALHPTR